MFSGHEFYGDDITSGLADESPTFRAFCEADDCAWSSAGCDTEDTAAGHLEDHTETAHPGEPWWARSTRPRNIT